MNWVAATSRRASGAGTRAGSCSQPTACSPAGRRGSRAGLVDQVHTVVVPIPLGRGVRLCDGPEGLEKDYEVEAASSPRGVTHVTFTRAGV
jgi:hypothetical protein